MQRSHPADENGEASAQDACRLGTPFVDCWVLLRSDKYHYYYIIITTDVFQLENLSVPRKGGQPLAQVQRESTSTNLSQLTPYKESHSLA